MSNHTLLAVMAHKPIEHVVHRHTANWKRTGCKMVGVSSRDGLSWPDEFHSSLRVGDMQHCGPSILERFMETFGWAAHFPHEQICVIEWDNIILGKIPLYGHGFHAKFVPNYDAKFKSARYLVEPWICDAGNATLIYRYGMELIKRGDIEHGYTDRFIAYIVDQLGIPCHDIGAQSYCPATITPELMPEARQAIKDGAIFIHGVKNEQILNDLLGDKVKDWM